MSNPATQKVTPVPSRRMVRVCENATPLPAMAIQALSGARPREMPEPEVAEGGEAFGEGVGSEPGEDGEGARRRGSGLS